jgi:uncharacterized cupredoxin-like copper-binding protein
MSKVLQSKGCALRRFLPTAALVVGIGMASSSHAAGTVVNVSLWDKGSEMPMATDLGFPGAGKDMSKATMGVALSQETAGAGETTFEVLNSSKDSIHEMIIMRLREMRRPGTCDLPLLSKRASREREYNLTEHIKCGQQSAKAGREYEETPFATCSGFCTVDGCLGHR